MYLCDCLQERTRNIYFSNYVHFARNAWSNVWSHRARGREGGEGEREGGREGEEGTGGEGREANLAASDLPVGVAHFIPYHFHSIIRVDGQVGCINTRDIAGHL